MTKRSRLQIYFEVLQVIERGTIKPTKIMYKTNLSWNTLCRVFEVLIDSAFIIREEKKKNVKRYYVTGKGKRALMYYRRSIEELAATPFMT